MWSLRTHPQRTKAEKKKTRNYIRAAKKKYRLLWLLAKKNTGSFTMCTHTKQPVVRAPYCISIICKSAVERSNCTFYYVYSSPASTMQPNKPSFYLLFVRPNALTNEYICKPFKMFIRHFAWERIKTQDHSVCEHADKKDNRNANPISA